MIHFCNHTGDLGRELHFNGSIELTKSQRLDRTDLRFRSLDSASRLCDLYLTHDALAVKYFRQ